jgi:hypothetical protein
MGLKATQCIGHLRLAKLVAGPCPEADESCPQAAILFFKDMFQYYPPIYA